MSIPAPALRFLLPVENETRWSDMLATLVEAEQLLLAMSAGLASRGHQFLKQGPRSGL
ncbi:hypothetical protein [Isoptericola croceus]|uniref:hypothetical protein n=1 Tax=Isoptericola croceus TaxID=3031406 RepID=UPI0023F6228D|nr:hypothetical protein [Isoptericola croceus]